MGITDDKTDAGAVGAAGGTGTALTGTGGAPTPIKADDAGKREDTADRKEKAEGHSKVIFRGTADKNEHTKYIRCEDSHGNVKDHGIGGAAFEIRDEVLATLRGLGYLFDTTNE